MTGNTVTVINAALHPPGQSCNRSGCRRLSRLTAYAARRSEPFVLSQAAVGFHLRTFDSLFSEQIQWTCRRSLPPASIDSRSHHALSDRQRGLLNHYDRDYVTLMPFEPNGSTCRSESTPPVKSAALTSICGEAYYWPPRPDGGGVARPRGRRSGSPGLRVSPCACIQAKNWSMNRSLVFRVAFIPKP